MEEEKNKEIQHFRCIYYNPIAQEDQMVNIDAVDLKTAYLTAYLYFGRKYDFEDINVSYRYDTAISLDEISMKYPPTQEDYDKLKEFVKNEQLEDE